MKDIGAGEIIYDLQKKIQQIQIDLKKLDNPISDIPELILSANLIRENEYLLKINLKKSELLSLYEQYSGNLEELFSSVFEIQFELKEILKEQSSLISSSSKPKTKPKTKPKIKPKIKPKTKRKK